MIVVSNTSPILCLAITNHIDILEKLYPRIIIPTAVYEELTRIISKHQQLQFVKEYSWIEKWDIKDQPFAKSLMLELDEGEAEAIALSLEIKADLLLIDEKIGRRAASHFNLKYIGLLGVLLDAKRKGHVVSVKSTLDDVISEAGFWISKQLYHSFLKEAGE
jgi:uncharacterized protein